MALLLEPADYLDIGLGKIIIEYMCENLNLFCKNKRCKSIALI
jgi:hypothetical protein